jgi:hypothetical protein
MVMYADVWRRWRHTYTTETRLLTYADVWRRWRRTGATEARMLTYADVWRPKKNKKMVLVPRRVC